MKLAFGLALPDGCIAAWGARAIYTENKAAYKANHTQRGTIKKRGLVNYFNISYLWDRKAQAGDEAVLSELLTWLDKEGLPRLLKECNEKHVTPNSETEIEFTEGRYHLKACPRRSYGYLYIAAWVLS